MAASCALIGDLVGSRDSPDRTGLHRRLTTVLDDLNQQIHPLQDLEVTVGDEFQGVFATVGQATRAALLVRLTLVPVVDVRCGLGAGEVHVIDADRNPMVQDGSAWWSAREALEEMARPRRQAARTWYVGPGADGVMAFLLVRDAAVDRLGPRGQRLLSGALLGRTQADLAASEGIGRSTVSHHFARGVGAVSEAQDRFVTATAAGEGDPATEG